MGEPEGMGARLSTRMRAVLIDAKSRDLHRTAGDWPAHPSTLAALVRHGFLARNDRRNKQGNRVTVWSITTEGRKALLPRERPIRNLRPLYLSDVTEHSPRGLTQNPKKRIDNLEVALSAGEHWRVQGEVSRLAAQTKREQVKELVRLAKKAA